MCIVMDFSSVLEETFFGFKNAKISVLEETFLGFKNAKINFLKKMSVLSAVFIEFKYR